MHGYMTKVKLVRLTTILTLVGLLAGLFQDLLKPIVVTTLGFFEVGGTVQPHQKKRLLLV